MVGYVIVVKVIKHNVKLQITVNGFYFDQKNKRILDKTGQGYNDIQNRILRIPNEDEYVLNNAKLLLNNCKQLVFPSKKGDITIFFRPSHYFSVKIFPSK